MTFNMAQVFFPLCLHYAQCFQVPIMLKIMPAKGSPLSLQKSSQQTDYLNFGCEIL